MKAKRAKKQEKAPAHRPRITWPVIEGMAACASQIGVQPALLKQVKQGGSRAFLTGNRVDTAILLPELFAVLLARREEEILIPAVEQAKLNRERRIAQALETAKNVELLHHRDQVEDYVWENGVQPVRTWIMGLRTLLKQVDDELQRAQTPEATRTTVGTILNRGIDDGLAACRSAIKGRE